MAAAAAAAAASQGSLDATAGSLGNSIFRNFNGAVTEGSAEGSGEGLLEGPAEGSAEGSTEVPLEGSAEGSAEGSVEGPLEGSAMGSAEGSVEGPLERSATGSAARSAEGSRRGRFWPASSGGGGGAESVGRVRVGETLGVGIPSGLRASSLKKPRMDSFGSLFGRGISAGLCGNDEAEVSLADFPCSSYRKHQYERLGGSVQSTSTKFPP